MGYIKSLRSKHGLGFMRPSLLQRDLSHEPVNDALTDAAVPCRELFTAGFASKQANGHGAQHRITDGEANHSWNTHPLHVLLLSEEVANHPSDGSDPIPIREQAGRAVQN